MNKRVRIMLAILLLAAVSVSGWRFLHAYFHEPAYQGKSVSVWIQSLTNGIPAMQARAALQKIGLPAVPYLVAAFGKSDDLLTKTYSKLWYNSPAAARRLLPEPFPWQATRTRIAEAIGFIGHHHWWVEGAGDAPTPPELERAVNVLARALADPKPGVRSSSVQALEYLGPYAKSAVPGLIKMFNRGSLHERVMVCQAFGTIGPCSDVVQAVQVLQVLGNALNDSESGLNIAAVQALGAIGPSAASAVPALVERVASSDEQMRRSSLRALARIGSLPESIRPKLVLLLNETNDFTRAGAAIALLRLNPGDLNAVAVAKDCLGAQKPDNVRSSTVYLSMAMRTPPRDFLPQLRLLARGPDSGASRFARIALGRMAPEAAAKEDLN